MATRMYMNENKRRKKLSAVPLRNTDKGMFERLKDVKRKRGHRGLALLLLWTNDSTNLL